MTEQGREGKREGRDIPDTTPTIGSTPAASKVACRSERRE